MRAAEITVDAEPKNGLRLEVIPRTDGCFLVRSSVDGKVIYEQTRVMPAQLLAAVQGAMLASMSHLMPVMVGMLAKGML